MTGPHPGPSSASSTGSPSRSSSRSSSEPLHVAVVGSGPAGFYAADALLASEAPQVRVDMIERLPTPWGLVRSGVAPDHPKIKSVADTFEQIAAHPAFRWYGHVALGTDVTREELKEVYDAVVYAIGAQTDRHLGVPGEQLAGCVAATDVVGWYNGHPHFHDVEVGLHGERAVVVGNGNVALDVARMLCTDVAELNRTDIADHALAVLSASAVREVLVVGRRGPAQATFTTLELRELGALGGVDVSVQPAGVLDIPEDGLAPAVRRNLAALRVLAATPPTGTPGARRLVFRFWRSPIALEASDAGSVARVVLAVNEPEVAPDGRIVARDTGQREVVDAGLVVRAVGYLGVPVAGLPFDAAAGHIPHEQGRVEGGDREYVVGWIKRGPTGVIGTNKKDARESVARLLADLGAAGPRDPRPDRPVRLEAWLRERQPALVTDEGWHAIDEVERAAGVVQGRPRVKLVHTDDLLAAARRADGSWGS
ncbi:MAG: oxidoreductase [Nocardioidaceae bacterium]|nr:oxidoreductase [Nocardioidaceae bacterium]